MSKFAFIAWVLLVIVGCTTIPANRSEIQMKAIYLVQGTGQLSSEDLRQHPEVAVTDSLEEFKQRAKSKAALWIDINAVSLVDIRWLSDRPQAYYPVVLVGNGDASCSFFDVLPYFVFIVPCCQDCSSPPSGFSVNLLTSESGGTMHGYEQTPTVQAILEITNPMLKDLK